MKWMGINKSSRMENPSTPPSAARGTRPAAGADRIRRLPRCLQRSSAGMTDIDASLDGYEA
jgi:hypothetical protein